MDYDMVLMLWFFEFIFEGLVFVYMYGLFWNWILRVLFEIGDS